MFYYFYSDGKQMPYDRAQLWLKKNDECIALELVDMLFYYNTLNSKTFVCTWMRYLVWFLFYCFLCDCIGVFVHVLLAHTITMWTMSAHVLRVRSKISSFYFLSRFNVCEKRIFCFVRLCDNRVLTFV